jgi:hypothetical protein
MTIYPARASLSLHEAARPLRTKHHPALRELAEWSLSVGRPIDADIAAICMEALEDDLDREPERVLTRPLLNGIQWASIHNEATAVNAHLPDDWRVHFWTLLCWYVATNRLSSASDPLPALLEPLQCYGGLGADGLARPAGVDVAFVCQCYVPFDPKLPEGQAKVIIGHDPTTYEQLLLTVHAQHRSAEAAASAFSSLAHLQLRAGPDTLRVTVDPLEWHFVGRADATADAPELWLYDRTNTRHDYPLMLDASGLGWTPRVDRRRKLGYRLRALSLVTTLGWAASRSREDRPDDARDLSARSIL